MKLLFFQEENTEQANFYFDSKIRSLTGCYNFDSFKDSAVKTDVIDGFAVEYRKGDVVARNKYGLWYIYKIEKPL